MYIKLSIGLALVCGHWGYRNLYRLFQKTRSSVIQYKLLETLQGQSGKGEVMELSPAHGRALYHWELCAIRLLNCRNVHANWLWTCSQSLKLHIPRSSACPSALWVQGFTSQTLCWRRPTGVIDLSSSKKQAGWRSSYSWVPLFLSPKSHIHIRVKRQQPAYSLLFQLKTHMLFSLASLYSNLSVRQSSAAGLRAGACYFFSAGDKTDDLKGKSSKYFITKL